MPHEAQGPPRTSAMRTTPRFRSSIPRHAEARITEWHANGAKATAEYFIDGQLVGARRFDAEGSLELDCGWRDGRLHGTTYRIDIPGRLLSATPYSRGLEHGKARQWGDDGRLLGTYRMHRGTGIDLWWDETWRKPRRRYLAEVRFYRCGQRHGFEWWINEDQASFLPVIARRGLGAAGESVATTGVGSSAGVITS